MDTKVIRAFSATSQLRRQDVFESDNLMPKVALDDAHTPAPGWVGRRWNHGTLLIGINPGGGGDNYRRNPDDDELYRLLRRFRDARTDAELVDRFATVSEAWIRIQRGHNIWRIIGPILAATGETVEQAAFMNILPFRTRMDAVAKSSELTRAYLVSSGPQIAALKPARVIALGKKAWDVLQRVELPNGLVPILFKRGIGDSYIPEESKQVLRVLSARGS